MRRWTCRVILLLLLGVTTNVLLIARFAYAPPDDLTMPLANWWTWRDAAHDRPWSVAVKERFDITYVRADGLTRGFDTGYSGQLANAALPPDLPRWSAIHDPALRAPDFDRLLVREYAMGWPLRSARYYGVWQHDDVDPTKSRQFTHGAFDYRAAVHDQFYGDSLVMPLIPIWPGVFVNAFFFAAIWFALVVGLRPLRRALHRRRGRCPMCGYDLRGELDVGCPECGWNRTKT